jgi:hypothetical protein
LVVTIPDGCRVACLKSDRQQVMYQLFPTGKRRAERVGPSRPSYLYLPDSLREMHIALLTSPRDFSPEPDNAALLARRKRAVSGVARRYYGGRPVRERCVKSFCAPHTRSKYDASRTKCQELFKLPILIVEPGARQVLLLMVRPRWACRP